jgi:hypothetical protein
MRRSLEDGAMSDDRESVESPREPTLSEEDRANMTYDDRIAQSRSTESHHHNPQTRVDRLPGGRFKHAPIRLNVERDADGKAVRGADGKVIVSKAKGGVVERTPEIKGSIVVKEAVQKKDDEDFVRRQTMFKSVELVVGISAALAAVLFLSYQLEFKTSIPRTQYLVDGQLLRFYP